MQKVCDDGCISNEKYCDVEFDCFSLSDENDCARKKLTDPMKSEFLEKFRQRKKCIVKYNSMNTLITKARYPFHHLINCTNIKCNKNEYKCKLDGYCIPIDRVCDGVNQCLHGDDELFCSKKYLLYFYMEF